MIASQSNRMISGGGFNSRRLDGGWEKTKINRSILGRFRDNRGGEWPSKRPNSSQVSKILLILGQ